MPMLIGPATISAINEMTTVPNEHARVPNAASPDPRSWGEVAEALFWNAGHALEMWSKS